MMLRRTIAFTAVLVSLSACKCLPVPSSDPTSPGASLVIDWHDRSGTPQNKTFTALDPPETIQVHQDRDIGVMYIGADNEGLRIVHLDYDMWRSTGTGIQRPLLVAKNVDSSCPRKSLTGVETFNPGGLNWNFTFVARAVNWLGQSTSTPTITFNAGPGT